LGGGSTGQYLKIKTLHKKERKRREGRGSIKSYFSRHSYSISLQTFLCIPTSEEDVPIVFFFPEEVSIDNSDFGRAEKAINPANVKVFAKCLAYPEGLQNKMSCLHREREARFSNIRSSLSSSCERSIGTVFQLPSPDAIHSQDEEKKRSMRGYPAFLWSAHRLHALGGRSDRRKEATRSTA
jgi:hypothetical protein